MVAFESRTHTPAFVESTHSSPTVPLNADFAPPSVPDEVDNIFTVQPHMVDADGVREKCGVAAVLTTNGEQAFSTLQGMVNRLQHRGYDSTGIGMTTEEGGIIIYKKLGKVDSVFPQDFPYEEEGLTADRGVAHVRYGTTSNPLLKDSIDGAHPMEAEHEGFQLALAFNGNIPDQEMSLLASRIPEGREVPPYDTAYLTAAITTASGETLPEKVSSALDGIIGYSIVGVTNNGEVFATRCAAGVWPLWVGKGEDRVYLASETIAGDPKDKIEWREVRPGEFVQLTEKGYESIQLFEEPEQEFRCTLNALYLAHPDSQMTDMRPGFTYYEFREEGGRMLRRNHPSDADIIEGIPNSGTPMGRGAAKEAGKESPPILKAVGPRSYIQQTPGSTHKVNEEKFAVGNPDLLVGKKYEGYEDTLVKGNSAGGDWKKREEEGSEERGGVVGFLRANGAREVHLRVLGPKIVRQCDLGIHNPEDQLVALERKDGKTVRVLSDQEIAARIGADSVKYSTREELGDLFENQTGCRGHCSYCLGGPHPREMLGQRKIQQRELVRVGD